MDGVDWGLGDDNPLSIVITNACDLEHDHSGFLMVAALEPAAEVLGASKEFQSLVKDSTDGLLKRKQIVSYPSKLRQSCWYLPSVDYSSFMSACNETD